MWIGLGLLLFALASTAFLAFLGYGPAKLLLPREWRSDEGWLAPLLGYVLLLLVGYYAARTALNLVGALFLAVGLGLLLTGLALWLRRGERLFFEFREHGPAYVVAFVAFLLAVLPLLHYGTLTPIGENWDPENYLPVTEYLRQAPVGRIEEMPPNPLRELNAHPPRIGLTLGFSILQGILEQLPGWDARASFAPTIALLRGLTVLALYGLFRRGLHMGRRPALLATLLGGLYALALWIALFNFGMQMAAMPLVPLALALFLVTLRRPCWRTVLLAAAAVAALPVAYYPALTVFVPMASALGLVELLQAQRRREVLLAGLGTALLAAALAWGTILDYGEGFSFRYSQQMTTLGLFQLPPWDQILGLVPFSRTAGAAAGESGFGLLTMGLLLILWAAALWRSHQRWQWLAALGPGALYLGWLQGWFWPVAQALNRAGLLGTAAVERFRAYPYAFLKGAVFVAPLALGLAVEGWEICWEWTAAKFHPRPRAFGQAMLLLILLLPIGLTLHADGQLLARYWDGPAHFGPEVLQVEEAVDLLPAGATVYLTGRPERSRPVLGLFAYFLREHPLYGRLSTAYGDMDRRLPGEAPAYALLDADDDPYLLGFFPEGQLWSGGGVVLYERPPAVVSVLDLRADAYTGHPAGAIHGDEPLAGRLLNSFGPYPTLAGDPLVLYADSERISLHDDLAGRSGNRSLLIALAALEPGTVTLRWDDGTVEEVSVPAGFSFSLSPARALPAQVEIALEGDGPVWVCWAALLEGEPSGEMLTQPPEALLLPQASAAGDLLTVELDVHNESGRPLRLALEIWENSYESAHHDAWWGLLPLPERGSVRLEADLAGREAQAWIGEEEVPFPPHPGGESWPERADGSYFASLWVYYGHHVVEVLPVGQFRLQGGQVQQLQPIELGLRPIWPHSPAQASGARFGQGIELRAYDRSSDPVAPGDVLSLALEWHALEPIPTDYFVTAQVLGEGRLWGQWDGPIGQWLPATAWHEGQFIRDDIPLQVDEGAPAGRYRLIVAVYDLATGTRLVVRSAAGQELGDALDLGEVVVR